MFYVCIYFVKLLLNMTKGLDFFPKSRDFKVLICAGILGFNTEFTIRHTRLQPKAFGICTSTTSGAVKGHKLIKSAAAEVDKRKNVQVYWRNRNSYTREYCERTINTAIILHINIYLMDWFLKPHTYGNPGHSNSFFHKRRTPKHNAMQTCS